MYNSNNTHRKTNKILLAVTVLSISSTLFFAYRYFSIKNTGIIQDPISKTRCAACSEYNNTGLPASKLKMNLVKTMAYSYQNPISPSETRSVWFSIETIKSFIYNIEHNACGCTGNLGLRIYYGRYPSPTLWNNFGNDLGTVQSSYAGIHTVFMVPTINVAGKNHDFDPADVSMRCNPGYNSSYGIAKDTTLAFQLNSGSGSITALMAQNHGDACPPVPTGMGHCPDNGAYFDF
jgi:hypothetical protein